MQQITRPRHNVDILTPEFRVTGQVEPIGPWFDFMNNPDRYTLTVHNAHLCPLGKADGRESDHTQAILNKQHICMVILLDAEARETVHALSHTNRAISHVGPFICRSDFHMGAETQLVTFFDDMVSDYFVVSNADLHSTITAPTPLPSHVDMLLVNRAQAYTTYPI